MADTFEVTYGNDDGYAGGSRPHSFDIDAGELDGGMTEESIKEMFWREIQEDFERSHLHLYCGQEDEFVAWAKEQIAKMQEAE